MKFFLSIILFIALLSTLSHSKTFHQFLNEIPNTGVTLFIGNSNKIYVTLYKDGRYHGVINQSIDEGSWNFDEYSQFQLLSLHHNFQLYLKFGDAFPAYVPEIIQLQGSSSYIPNNDWKSNWYMPKVMTFDELISSLEKKESTLSFRDNILTFYRDGNYCVNYDRGATMGKWQWNKLNEILTLTDNNQMYQLKLKLPLASFIYQPYSVVMNVDHGYTPIISQAEWSTSWYYY